MGRAPILLSVVIPYRNDDGSAPAMLAAVGEAIAPLVTDYEIIVVENGSPDEHFVDYAPVLRPDGLRNVQIYRLIQTVDPHVAAWAGVENSLGDYVLVFDPRNEDLSRLADALREVAAGRDIVYLRNTVSKDFGPVQQALGPVFRWLLRRLTGTDLAADATPGRLISKRVVSYLMSHPQPSTRYRALPSQSGFSKITLAYAAPRSAKHSQGLFARARSAVRLVVTNSIAPLRIVSIATLFGALSNLLYSTYVVVVALVKPDVAPGWTTLSLQQSGMFFLLSTVMLVLTEYLIQIIRWTSRGPSYFVASEATSSLLSRRERLNVEPATPPGQEFRDHLAP